VNQRLPLHAPACRSRRPFNLLALELQLSARLGAIITFWKMEFGSYRIFRSSGDFHIEQASTFDPSVVPNVLRLEFSLPREQSALPKVKHIFPSSDRTKLIVDSQSAP
jgi:hypothetical protein